MLRQNRLDQNLSLRALAERTGISAMYLSDVENGVQRPADYTLRKLFSELALPYDPALLWQPEFTLHPLTQAILDYRMDRRDAFFDDCLLYTSPRISTGCEFITRRIRFRNGIERMAFYSAVLPDRGCRN